jgi:hypothetical protein
MFYFVIFIQMAINTGIGIGAILFAGQCLEVCLLDLYFFYFFIFKFYYSICLSASESCSLELVVIFSNFPSSDDSWDDYCPTRSAAG